MEASPNEVLSFACMEQNGSTSLKENTTSINDEATNHTSTNHVEEDNSHFESKKRQKTSSVWLEFQAVVVSDRSTKAECNHCKTRLSILKSKSKSHFARHLKTCLRRKIYQKQQQKITLEVVDPELNSQVVTPALTDGKFDMMK